MASSKPEYHVPGAYHFDNPPWPVPTLGSNVYLPPETSPSSVFNLEGSTASLYSNTSTPHNTDSHTAFVNMKRKRMAHDSRETTPLTDWPSMSTEAGGDQFLRFADQAPDNEKGNIQYTLAGQIANFGTPISSTMDDSAYSDVDYRRALGPHRMYEAHEGHEASVNQPEVDVSARTPALEQWTVLHVLGNVVGKVWEFCKAGAFRGFHAGGGVSYDWETGKPTGQDEFHEQEVPPLNEEPVSGRLPSTDDCEDAKMTGDLPQPNHEYTKTISNLKEEMPAQQESPFRRAGKRRQVGAAGEELGRNWVIVDSEQARNAKGRRATTASPSTYRMAATTAHIPTRRPSIVKPRTPDSTQRRISMPEARLGSVSAQANRWNGSALVSHAGSSKLSPRAPASFASSRSVTSAMHPPLDPGGSGRMASRIPVPSSSCSPTNPFAHVASPVTGNNRAKSRHEYMPVSPTRPGSSRRSHRRGYSTASVPSLPRNGISHGALGETIDASPRLDLEARQLAARRHAAELDADAKIEAFNLRLQAMIRQGKEALGTAFEIDGDAEQENWMDDD